MMLILGDHEWELLHRGTPPGGLSPKLQAAVERLSDAELMALEAPRVEPTPRKSTFVTNERTQERLRILALKKKVRTLDLLNAIIRHTMDE